MTPPPRSLVFATRNANKAREVRALLAGRFGILTLPEAGIDIDIPEPHPTIEANAAEKTAVVHRLTGQDCFGEDTGLEVAALGGAPGVHSARYAGSPPDDQANIRLLMQRMQGVADRSARFRTVFSLRIGGAEHRFEGTCAGHIAPLPAGNAGFGYDPVFIPDGETITFAEMDLDGKNRFSHRRKALEAMLALLDQTHPPAAPQETGP